MTSPRIRRPLITLLAVLHLLVQPLASTAWCAFVSAVGDDCRCHAAEPEATEPSSCCRRAAAPAGPDEPGEEPKRPPCHCTASPEPLPGTVPEPLPVPDEVYVRNAFSEIVIRLFSPVQGIESARPFGGRAPGVPRPPRVLFQVFRL